MNSLDVLYKMSGISRTSVAEYLGYDFEEEADKLESEEAIIEAKGLSEFGQQPFSATGKLPGTDTGTVDKPTTEKKPAAQKVNPAPNDNADGKTA
jgi:hypothetical protein